MVSRVEGFREKTETRRQSALLLWGLVKDSLSYPSKINLLPEPEKLEGENIMGVKTILHFYRMAVGVEPKNFASHEAFCAMATFYTLISRYDDMLDGHKGPDPITIEELRNEPVCNALTDQGRSLLTKDQTRKEKGQAYMEKFDRFLLQEYAWYRDFYDRKETAGFEEVKKYKENTCGLNGKMVAELLQLFCPNLSDDAAKRGEALAIAGLLYAQVYDDVGDFLIDTETNTPNFFQAALEENPDEKMAVMAEVSKKKRLKVKQLRQLAPEAFKLCDAAAAKYLEGIPVELDDLKKLLPPVRDYLAKVK